MTTKDANTTAEPVAAATAAPMTAAEVARIVAETISTTQAAERTRQAGIRNCDEAKGREPLANHLANDTDLSVDVAKGILAAAPKTAEPVVDTNGQRPSGFAGAMDATGNPVIKPDAGTGAAGIGAEAQAPEALAARILGSFGQASGQVIELKPNKAA